MKFTAVYEPAAEGGYVAWLEEMPGVQTQGETLDEAKANLLDAFQLSLKYLREKARKSRVSPERPRNLRAGGAVKLADLARGICAATAASSNARVVGIPSGRIQSVILGVPFPAIAKSRTT